MELQSPSRQRHETEIALNTISIPMSLKYIYALREYSVFLQVGPNLDFHVKESSSVMSERQINSNTIVATDLDEAFIIDQSQVGFWAGLGFVKHFKKFDAGLTARYLHTPSLNKFKRLTVHHNRASVNLILLMK